MSRLTRDTRFSVGLAALVALSVITIGGVEADRRPRDFVAQIATVAAIRDAVQELGVYSEAHKGKMPGSLEELRAAHDLPESIFVDGWKRPLYYYTTGSSYVLISFGHSGRPDPQESKPGELANEEDYESDIVLIDGEWAQSPADVGRVIP